MWRSKASRPVSAAADYEPRDCSLGRTRNLATPDCHRFQAAPIRIDVKPTASGRKWRASVDGKALGASTSPLVMAARILIGKGVNPARTVEMWCQHADAWSLRGQLGAVAATLIDGEKAQRCAKNGPPMRQNRRGVAI
jgi:hypothetical protein